MRVGTIWLHENELKLLRAAPMHFDRIDQKVLLDLGQRGALWGMLVMEDPVVLPGHIVMLQDDIEVKSIGPGAQMSLGREYLGIEVSPEGRLTHGA